MHRKVVTIVAKKGIMLVEEVGYKPTVNKKQVGEKLNDKKKDNKEERK